eukprot:2430246-Lingulodinium_polyedra.AAC.1
MSASVPTETGGGHAPPPAGAGATSHWNGNVTHGNWISPAKYSVGSFRDANAAERRHAWPSWNSRARSRT